MPSPEQLFWMRHGLQLNRERLRAPHLLSPEEVGRLIRYVEALEEIAACLERDETPSALLQPDGFHALAHAHDRIAYCRRWMRMYQAVGSQKGRWN